MAFAVIFSGQVLAETIYSHVDTNGNHVFSDEKTTASREVQLNQGTIVSGEALGRKVKYKYGRPESGRGSASVNAGLRQQAAKKRQCDEMKGIMNSSAGRLKLNTEERYNRECILGQ